MHQLITKIITPRKALKATHVFGYVVLLLVLLALLSMVLSLFFSEAFEIAIIFLFFSSLFGISYVLGVMSNIYRACLFETHLEIINYRKKVLRRINYEDISVLKIMNVSGTMGGRYRAHYSEKSICIGVDISEDQLDKIISFNEFMDILRYDEKCLPMVYDEDIYAHISSKVKSSIIL